MKGIISAAGNKVHKGTVEHANKAENCYREKRRRRKKPMSKLGGNWNKSPDMKLTVDCGCFAFVL